MVFFSHGGEAVRHHRRVTLFRRPSLRVRPSLRAPRSNLWRRVKKEWIASLSLSSGAHSRDPVARNDGDKKPSKINKAARRANHFRFTEIVSSEKSARIENNSLYPKYEVWHMIVIPSRPEGRSRSSRTRGGERWTWKRLRRTAWKRTAKTCGPDAPMLASSLQISRIDPIGRLRASDGDNEPGPTGEITL